MSADLLSSTAADVKVYAVWLPVLRSDGREEWDPGTMPDSRVEHFWDEDRLVGNWFLHAVTRRTTDRVEWDAFFLYGRDARWGMDPPPLVRWGRTILATRDELRAGLMELLGAKEPKH